ncbi:MAG TPA: hypothetical protein ENF72_02625 [Thermococcus litoralis]|uniref:CGP-CTERM sorting domain-containing protein n=1 Tax=Thermococcus litoralis TaxID=2265 RepID=A0A7C0Y6K9_THELI|nr:hypothetical protein [Thermococcus litoralis]
MKKLIVPIVLFLLPFAYAQELEYLTWGGDDVDTGIAYLPSDGYSFLIGSTRSFEDTRGTFIVKINDEGNPEFQKLIYSSHPIFIKDALLFGDTIYIVGQIGSSNFQEADAFIAALDTNGKLKYFKTFGRSSNDGAEAIDITNDKIYVVGYTYPTGSVQRAFLAEISPNGSIDWIVEFGEEGSKATAVKATSSAVYVGGDYEDGVFVCAFDLRGKLEWARAYPLKSLKNLEFRDALYAVGTTYEDRGFGNAFILKLSPDGSAIWKKHFGIGYGDTFVSLMFNNSEMILAGHFGNFTAGNRDGLIAKFNSSGELLWFGIIQGGGEDIVAKAVMKDGLIYGAGYTDDFSKTFIVPKISEVTWKSLYSFLDVKEGKYSAEPKKIILETSEYKVSVKNINGILNQPKNGDAWFFKFGRKEEAESETPTSPTPTETTSTSSFSPTQTKTTTTIQTSSPSSTTTTQTWKHSTTTSETSKTSSTQPQSSTASTESTTGGGICGPGFVLLIALIPPAKKHLLKSRKDF